MYILAIVLGLSFSILAIKNGFRYKEEKLFIPSMCVFLVIYIFIVEYRTLFCWSIWGLSPLVWIVDFYGHQQWNVIFAFVISAISYISSFLVAFMTPLHTKTKYEQTIFRRNQV